MVSCPSCSPAAPGASLPVSRGACRALTCRERGQQGSAGGPRHSCTSALQQGPSLHELAIHRVQALL